MYVILYRPNVQHLIALLPRHCHPPLCAVWDVGLTVDARVARFAGAGVAVDVVGAGSSVPAGGALALVHLHCAARAREARQTAALEAVDAVCARASIQTWILGWEQNEEQKVSGEE